MGKKNPFLRGLYADDENYSLIWRWCCNMPFSKFCLCMSEYHKDVTKVCCFGDNVWLSTTGCGKLAMQEWITFGSRYSIFLNQRWTGILGWRDDPAKKKCSPSEGSANQNTPKERLKPHLYPLSWGIFSELVNIVWVGSRGSAVWKIRSVKLVKARVLSSKDV